MKKKSEAAALIPGILLCLGAEHRKAWSMLLQVQRKPQSNPRAPVGAEVWALEHNAPEKGLKSTLSPQAGYPVAFPQMWVHSCSALSSSSAVCITVKITIRRGPGYNHRAWSIFIKICSEHNVLNVLLLDRSRVNLYLLNDLSRLQAPGPKLLNCFCTPP